MWKRVKLSSDELLILKKYAKKNNIDFFCSVFDFPSLEIVKKLKINTIKIASSDITDIPLLKKIAKTKMKIFLSTGMASLKEINKALKILGKNKLTLLHCVSLYPCPLNKANIKRMIKLKKKFNVKIGYSDHCEGIDASLIAINNGASVIEKHFTDDKKRKGADHKLSADFSDLKQIVEYSNSKDTIMGDGIINPKKDELNMRKFARKSLFYDKDLNYKQKIKFEDIKIRRPFGEMEPIKIYSIINKKLKQSVKKGEIVKKKHFM
jgi:N,N'-diacetyllegionaminate synthase